MARNIRTLPNTSYWKKDLGSGSPSPACQLAKKSYYFRTLPITFRRLTKISDDSRKCSDLFRVWRVAFLCIFLHCIDSTHVSIPASVLHQRSSPEMNTMSPSLTRFSLNSCPVLSFSSLLLLFPNGYTAELIWTLSFAVFFCCRTKCG